MCHQHKNKRATHLVLANTSLISAFSVRIRLEWCVKKKARSCCSVSSAGFNFSSVALRRASSARLSSCKANADVVSCRRCSIFFSAESVFHFFQKKWWRRLPEVSHHGTAPTNHTVPVRWCANFCRMKSRKKTRECAPDDARVVIAKRAATFMVYCQVKKNIHDYIFKCVVRS